MICSTDWNNRYNTEMIDLACKKDFPIFEHPHPSGKPFVFLDSASTSQKPRQVLKAITTFYEKDCANVHRGVYALADRSTQAFEDARLTIASFFKAPASALLLTRNTTEALNWIVPMWLADRLDSTKSMIVTEMEHHSNFVPWQEICRKTGARLKVVSVREDGTLDLDQLETLMDFSVVAIAVSHVSNVLGTLNPIQQIQKIAQHYGAEVIVDGAQSAPHLPIDFQDSGVAFFAFSGHKMLGPMGIGGLLVRPDVLKVCRPALFGGGMIDQVGMDQTTFADIPDKFIPGTPDVASAVGLASACTFLTHLGMEKVRDHDASLVRVSLETLRSVPDVQIIGTLDVAQRVGSVAFLYAGVHGHDVAQILDSQGIAVRSGHHCTMPLHKKFGWPATVRASFSVYNSEQDLHALAEGLSKVRSIFRKNA